VDFAGDPLWKDLQQKHQDGALDPKLDRLYFAPTRPMFELYDLQNDPYELQSIHADADPALVEDLKAKLDALKSCTGQSCREAEDAF